MIQQLLMLFFGSQMAITREALDAFLLSAISQQQAARLSRENALPGGAYVQNGVGFLPVQGPLFSRSSAVTDWYGLQAYDNLAAGLDALLADASVDRIVLDMNTGGGHVAGCFDFVDHLHAARGKKPIDALVNESAFSAGYAIASAADRIILPRTAGVGSIGVIATHVDASGWYEKMGVKVEHITAGARKADYSDAKPLSDEARATLQSEVNKSRDLFAQTVSRNRAVSFESVIATEAGLYYGDDAVRAGLADKVLSARDALAMIARERDASRPQPQPTSGRVARKAEAMRIASTN